MPERLTSTRDPLRWARNLGFGAISAGTFLAGSVSSAHAAEFASIDCVDEVVTFDVDEPTAVDVIVDGAPWHSEWFSDAATLPLPGDPGIVVVEFNGVEVASADCSTDVEPTEPPVEPTEPPVEPTEPPVEPTEPPVEPIEPPVTNPKDDAKKAREAAKKAREAARKAAEDARQAAKDARQNALDVRKQIQDALNKAMNERRR